MQPQKIEFYKDRDLNDFFSDGFRFVKQNAGALIKAYLFFAAPFMLLGGLFNGLNLSSTLSGITFGSTMGYSWYLIPAYLTTIAATIIIIASTLSIFKLYGIHGPGQFTLSMIWAETKKAFFPALSILGWMILIVLIPVIVIGAIFFLAAEAAPLLLLVLAFLLIIGLILLLPLGYFFFGPYVSRILEGFTAMESLSRAWRLTKLRYWYTWLIVFLTALMMGVTAMLISMPTAIIQTVTIVSGAMEGDSDFNVTALVVMQVITTVLSALVYPFFYSLLTVHHFSLVERAEGTGTRQKLEELGSPA